MSFLQSSLNNLPLPPSLSSLSHQQNELSGVAEAITNRLSYFTELERLGQKLNAPSFSATSDYFPVLLTRLDECIAFIESHVSMYAACTCIYYSPWGSKIELAHKFHAGRG